MKEFIHSEDIDRIKALMEALDYDGNFELEIDSNEIGRTVTVHVPYSVNSLRGTFSYVISNVEDW
jgi:hypothetical protein